MPRWNYQEKFPIEHFDWNTGKLPIFFFGELKIKQKFFLKLMDLVFFYIHIKIVGFLLPSVRVKI